MAEEDLEVRARLVADANEFIDPFKQATVAAQQFQAALAPTNKLLIGAGAAVGAAGYALFKFGKEAFGVAARVSELNVAIDAVGKATNLGSENIRRAAYAIRDQGIEMDAAQKIALTYAQNNLDLASASKVARVAQDLAVISQRNSTDTAELLTRAIQTGSSILLKSAGISKYASEGYAAYARQIGKTTNSLTAAERQQAMINLVLTEGSKVAGLYEAAMTEPGKVLRSFARLQHDIREEMGMALLQGFGPVIKGLYDLTNAFSKTLREGGYLHPLIQAVGRALVGMTQPLTDALNKMTHFVKGLKGAEIGVTGLSDKMRQLAPIVAAVGTYLATFSGKKLLGLVPGLGKLVAGFSPLSAAIVSLVALSPKLRDSFMRLGAAIAPMIPSLLALAQAAAEVVGEMVDFVASVMSGFGGSVLIGAVKLLADAMALLAANTAVLKPVMFALVTFMAVRAVKSFWMAGEGAGMLAKRFKLVREAAANAIGSFRTQVAELQRYSATLSQGGMAMSKFGAAVRTGAAIAKVAIQQLVATMAPMLALYAAFEIYNYWRKEQDKVRNTTNAVTQAFKEQVYAAKGNKAAIAELLPEMATFASVMAGLPDKGEALTETFGALNVSADKAFAAFGDKNKGAIRNFNLELAKQNGIVFESAQQQESYLKVVENIGGWWNMDSLVLQNLTDAQREAAIKQKTLNDEMKAIDYADIVSKNMEYTAGLSTQNSEVYAAAKAEAERNGVLKGLIDTTEEADAVNVIFTRKLEEANATEKKRAEVMDIVKQKSKVLAAAINDLRTANEDGKVSAEAFSKAFEGEGYEALQVKAAVDGMRQSATALGEEVSKTKGSTDAFTSAGFKLRDMVASNAANLLSLGGNSADVANMMKGVIAQFTKGAKEAKRTDEEIKALLVSMKLLDENGQIRLTVDADIKKAQAQITYLTAYAMALEKTGRLTGNVADEVMKNYKALQDQMKANFTTADSFDTYTDAAKNAGEESKKVRREKERLKEAIMKIANEALEKATTRMEEYKAALDGIKSAAKEAIYGSYSLSDALSDAKETADKANQSIEDLNESFADYAKNVTDSIMDSLSLNDALSAQKAAASDMTKANEEVTKAQAKVNEEQALYDDLLSKAAGTFGRRARREAYEKAAEQATKLAEAQQELTKATADANAEQAKQKTFVERLREQAKLAVTFADQLTKLTSQGLSQDAIDQIVASGAEAGSQMAKELLDGGSVAIDEVNGLFKDLAKVSAAAGARMADHYKELGQKVGADFVAALASQAHKVSEFSEQVKRLVSMGLSPQNIQMVLQAGYKAGTEIAAAIESGGAETIAQLNDLEISLRGQGEALAKLLGDTFYQAGYDTAKNIVDGMKERIKTLQQEIEDATIPQLKAILANIGKEFDAMLKTLPKPVTQVVNPTLPNDGTGGDGGADTRTEDQKRAAAALAAGNIPFSNLALSVSGATEMSNAAKGMYSYETAVDLIRRRTGLAAGGIVTKPMVSQIGEAGPEAVIPLDRLGAMTGGGTTVINLTVNAGMGADGKTVGDAIVNELKRWTRRNGKLPVTTQ